MSKGKIKWITNRGVGFIVDELGNDLYFHRTAVEGTRFDRLTEGQRVSFEKRDGPKGPRAESVRKI